MAADYAYLLFFEREARLDALEGLSAITMPYPDGETTLVRTDRVVTLPLSPSGWGKTGPRISWDDSSPTWDFNIVLCCEPDEPIEHYLEKERAFDAQVGHRRAVDEHDARGQATITGVDLTVHNDMTERPSGTGEDLVLFEFIATRKAMSGVFEESESVRTTFTQLLEAHRGVYGLLDYSNWGAADLFWWRGERVAERIPAADVPLARIDEIMRRER